MAKAKATSQNCISRLNATQFSKVTNPTGVMLVYSRVDKDGLTVETALHFWGADYEVISSKENEFFRVWKNILVTFWSVKAKEMELRESNDGIRSNLRATTPSRIEFYSAKGVLVKSYNLEFSVWQKIGLYPSAKDLERSAKDYKNATHRATVASFDALGFRVDLQLIEKKATQKPKGRGKKKATETVTTETESNPATSDEKKVA